MGLDHKPLRRLMPIAATETAPNRTRVIASTDQLARDGHVVEPSGLDPTNFLKVGTILFDHNAAVPVGVPVAASLNAAGALEVEIEWPPEGVSPKADEVRGLVKAGILRSCSIGFEPIDFEPLDPAKPRGGQHITRAELLELSFVSVPADTGAVVTQRAAVEADWKVGASRDLAIEDSDAWDGAEAEASIFEHAGGDDFTPAKARKGFLVYDAAKPKERGSYKLPIAHVVDGELKVPKGAIRAAASRLPDTDIPDDVKDKAKAVLDHYKEKAGMSADTKDKDRAARVARVRALVAPVLEATTRPAASLTRGLYDVAQLAYAVDGLAWLKQKADYETEIEGDNSQVPAMIGEALIKAGAALCAMTQEEVSEAIKNAGLADAVEDEELDAGERAHVRAAKTPAVRAWRRALAVAKVRAGKALSAANQAKLDKAADHHEKALGHGKKVAAAQDAVGEQHAAIGAAHAKAAAQHDKMGDAIKAADADAVQRCYRALGKHLDAIGDAHDSMGDAHEDLGDAHRSMTRCVASAQRCVRSVIDGAETDAEDEDGDSKDVQKSGGASEDEGSRSADFRRRQAERLALAGAA